MSITDRDYMKSEAEPVAPASLLNRLNEIGERHAKLILTVSTVLIILTVLVVADAFWRQSRMERGMAELASVAGAPLSERIDALEGLRKEYESDGVIHPKTLYELANAFQEEAASKVTDEEALELIEKSIGIYKEFNTRYPNDPLTLEVNAALAAADKTKTFIETRRAAIRKASSLQTHPLLTAAREDLSLRFGPVLEEDPLAVLELPGEVLVELELSEDLAPNTVADFITLCETGAFNGQSFRKSEDGNRLELTAGGEPPIAHTLAAESNALVPEAGMLVMVPAEAGKENKGGTFFVLLNEAPDLKEHTLFGRVRPGGLGHLKTLDPEAGITTLRIEKKRDHPYTPVRIEK